jgi:hypothetical protein
MDPILAAYSILLHSVLDGAEMRLRRNAKRVGEHSYINWLWWRRFRIRVTASLHRSNDLDEFANCVSKEVEKVSPCIKLSKIGYYGLRDECSPNSHLTDAVMQPIIDVASRVGESEVS